MNASQVRALHTMAVCTPHHGCMLSTPWPHALHTMAVCSPHHGHMHFTQWPHALHTMAVCSPHHGRMHTASHRAENALLHSRLTNIHG